MMTDMERDSVSLERILEYSDPDRPSSASNNAAITDASGESGGGSGDDDSKKLERREAPWHTGMIKLYFS